MQVRVVADALIAAEGIGDGKLIPLAIVDAVQRPDLQELIRIHDHLPPGDVDVQWAESDESEDSLLLMLAFRRPMESVASIIFDLPERVWLIDQILTARMFYFQAGAPGDRYISTQNASRIFVEVPETGFGKYWEEIFHRHVAKQMRSQGIGRQQAKRAANEYIKEWRSFGHMRMKEGGLGS